MPAPFHDNSPPSPSFTFGDRFDGFDGLVSPHARRAPRWSFLDARFFLNPPPFPSPPLLVPLSARFSIPKPHVLVSRPPPLVCLTDFFFPSLRLLSALEDHPPPLSACVAEFATTSYDHSLHVGSDDTSFFPFLSVGLSLSPNNTHSFPLNSACFKSSSMKDLACFFSLRYRKVPLQTLVLFLTEKLSFSFSSYSLSVMFASTFRPPNLLPSPRQPTSPPPSQEIPPFRRHPEDPVICGSCLFPLNLTQKTSWPLFLTSFGPRNQISSPSPFVVN